MNIQDIIIEKIEDVGADGLTHSFCPYGGCRMDEGLFQCEGLQPILSCILTTVVKCKPEDCEDCQDYSDDTDCEGYHYGAYRYIPIQNGGKN